MTVFYEDLGVSARISMNCVYAMARDCAVPAGGGRRLQRPEACSRGQASRGRGRSSLGVAGLPMARGCLS